MTGFRRSDGTDLNALFMAGGTGVAGYPFTFYPYTTGAKQPATGFRRSDGVDLADIFQHIGVPLGNMINPLGYNGITYSDIATDPGLSAQASCRHFSNGTWDVVGNGYGTFATGNWWSSAPATGVGNSKYIRWTRTATHTQTGSCSFASNSAWVTIDATRGPWVSAQGNTSSLARADATYVVELSNDAVNVHSSQSVRLYAYSPKVSQIPI